jgi:catechol 2,3-dioxygenase-like lactoylglutathione lyase family enzyme
MTPATTSTGRAQPYEENSRLAVRFERLTLFCRDLDRSIEFYRDLLGLVSVEEKVIEGAAAGALLQLPPCRLRIAFLAHSTEADAMLGLFQIEGVELNRVAPPIGRPAHGQTVLVLATSEFDAIQERLEKAGVRFLTPPLRYPKRQASERSPAGIYREMIFYDPDDFLVSVMQIEPLPEEMSR